MKGLIAVFEFRGGELCNLLLTSDRSSAGNCCGERGRLRSSLASITSSYFHFRRWRSFMLRPEYLAASQLDCVHRSYSRLDKYRNIVVEEGRVAL